MECKYGVKSNDEYGMAPLLYACENCYLDIIEYITKECKYNVETND